MENVPDIDIVLVQNGHYPAGTGEPVVTVVPAAIRERDRSGRRARGVREMPITPGFGQVGPRRRLIDPRGRRPGRRFLTGPPPLFFPLHDGRPLARRRQRAQSRLRRPGLPVLSPIFRGDAAMRRRVGGAHPSPLRPTGTPIDYDIHARHGRAEWFREREYAAFGESFDDYLANIARVFTEVLRATAEGGFCAVVIGDSAATRAGITRRRC